MTQNLHKAKKRWSEISLTPLDEQRPNPGCRIADKSQDVQTEKGIEKNKSLQRTNNERRGWSYFGEKAEEL